MRTSRLCLNVGVVTISPNTPEVTTRVQVRWLTQVCRISWSRWEHSCRGVQDLLGLHWTCSWLQLQSQNGTFLGGTSGGTSARGMREGGPRPEPLGSRSEPVVQLEDQMFCGEAGPG